MSRPNAFRASYSDLKLIKTRQCVQVIFELPLADFDAAYTILGGMPNAASEAWFGIAPLKSAEREETRDKPKHDWNDLPPATQAALRCNQPVFQAFLREAMNYASVKDEDSAAVALRHICVIKSRSELSIDHRKRVLWHQLDSQFSDWLAKERVGA